MVRPSIRHLTLQSRLLVITALLLLAAMTTVGVASTQLLRQNLESQVDDALQENAVAVTASLPDLLATGRLLLLSDTYLEVSDADGSSPRAFCTRSAGDGCAAAPALPALTADYVARHQGRPLTLTDPTGTTSWRVVVVADPTAPVNIAVALPLTEVEDTLDHFRTVAVLVGFSVLVAGTALAALAIRRSFRPLADIESTAEAIASGNLSRRIPAAPPTTEVGRLGAALNAMLTRIERSFRAQERSEEQMRRFVADASHELRTPLAAIRGFAELYRQGAVRGEEDVARVMGRIEAESTRLGRLVEDLLLLARLDEAQRRRAAEPEPVDLAVLASDAVHDARALSRDREVRLTGILAGSGPGPAVVLADDAGLRQVVTNLLANAVHHTPPGTPVEVAVGRVQGPGGPESVLEVRDHGPGLTPEQAERVFERFYRVDASRMRGSGGGSGLGLAIVATIVTGHGGTVAVDETPGGGATFRLRFRAAGHPGPDPDLDDQPGPDER
ncbi:sensor histidine kinase [Kineococcus gynurae]|uniref:histidine kinase n=1 Tax=Kineococcus gynurae TaxID=452979 RepID=A0ABV5LWK3_9ACTN